MALPRRSRRRARAPRPGGLHRAPGARARHRVRSTIVVGLVVSVTGVACSDDRPDKNALYCGVVADALTSLESPAIDAAGDAATAQASIDATVELFRSITSDAPLAVQPEWQALVDSIETAATVNPDDPASLQLAADTARRSEAAATRIQHFTHDTCGIDIGTPPPDTHPVTATTPAPTAETDPDGG